MYAWIYLRCGGLCSVVEMVSFCPLEKSYLKSLLEFFVKSLVKFCVKSLVWPVVEPFVKFLVTSLKRASMCVYM